jgi:hypothetical protein
LKTVAAVFLQNGEPYQPKYVALYAVL